MTESKDVTVVEPTKPKGVGYAGVEMRERGGGAMLMPQSFGDVVGFATVMARSDVALPKHLRGNEGACLAVTMQAIRWEMDPFAVANKTYSVNDRLAYEAQLVAAVIHTRAPIARRPDYTYSGEGPTRKCKVEIEMLDGSTKEYESPTFAQIPTKHSPLWKSDPDQQLGYYAIRSWGRRHTPEVLLGVYTPEELAEARDGGRDITPQKSGVMERLQAAPNGDKGFSATVVDDALGKRLPVEPEAIDAVIDDAQEEQDATGINTGEAGGAEKQATNVGEDSAHEREIRPDDGVAPIDGNDATGESIVSDPHDWCAAQNRLIEAATTVAELNDIVNAPNVGKMFGALEAMSPALAKALAAAATGRRKALVDKERTQGGLL